MDNKFGVLYGGGNNPFREYVDRIRNAGGSVQALDQMRNLGMGSFAESGDTKRTAIASLLNQMSNVAGGSAFRNWMLNNQSAIDAAYEAARTDNKVGGEGKFVDFLASADPERSWWGADARDAGRPNSFRRYQTRGG